MDAAVPVSVLFQLFAAFNAAILGLVAFIRSMTRYRAPALRIAAALLLLLASVMVVITVDHAGLLDWKAELRVVESLLTLTAGPLIVALIASMNGRTVPATVLIGPPAIYVLLVLATVGGDHALLSIRALVLIQMGYTIIAWSLHFGARDRSNGTSRDNRRSVLSFWILAGLSAVHIAQLARMSVVDLPGLVNIVPIVTGVCFAAATFYFVGSGGAGLLKEFISLSAGQCDESNILERLQQLIEHDEIHLDRELRLAQAAKMLAISPSALSHAVNMGTGGNFSQLVNAERIAHARRLLASHAEQRTSVEAIAMMSGFHSRSAFYRAFRAEMGISPARYRLKCTGPEE